MNFSYCRVALTVTVSCTLLFLTLLPSLLLLVSLTILVAHTVAVSLTLTAAHTVAVALTLLLPLTLFPAVAHTVSVSHAIAVVLRVCLTGEGLTCGLVSLSDEVVRSQKTRSQQDEQDHQQLEEDMP